MLSGSATRIYFVKRIRCGRGVGDSLYLQAVCRHLVAKGERLEACSDFPDIFRALPVSVIPFTRANCQIVAHYTTRKRIDGTTQFQDCCINAGITEPVEFKIDWTRSDTPLTRQLAGITKPIICVQLPRNPMGRTDGFGAELLPDCRVIQNAINRLKGRAYLVQIGTGTPLFRFTGVDLDLNGQTSIADLLDVASLAGGFLGYCSFVVPLAESFDRPALFVWSRRGLNSRDPFVKRATPKKILDRPTCKWVIDDCQQQELEQAADALFEQAGTRQIL